MAARLADAETSEPFLAFAASHVEFGRVQYAVAATKTLTISHVSGAAHWRVVGAPKSWLAVEPSRGTLLSGETVSLKLTVRVDGVSALRLDAGAVPAGPPRAVAAALTSLLSTLAVSVCDSSFLPPLTGCDDDRISQWAFDLLEALPNAHYNVFVYVIALLREVLAKSWQTTAATRLATVARDMFLPSGEPDDARAHVFSAVRFLLTSNL